MTSDSFPARVGGNNYLRRACLGRCHSRPATAEVSASVSCIARVLRDWSTLVLDSDVNVTLGPPGSGFCRQKSGSLDRSGRREISEAIWQ